MVMNYIRVVGSILKVSHFNSRKVVAILVSSDECPPTIQLHFFKLCFLLTCAVGFDLRDGISLAIVDVKNISAIMYDATLNLFSFA